MIDRLLFPETFADILARLWKTTVHDSVMQRNPAIVMKVNLPVPHQLHKDIPRVGRVFVHLQDRPTSVSDSHKDAFTDIAPTQ